jgi:calcium-binding protein CML
LIGGFYFELLKWILIVIWLFVEKEIRYQRVFNHFDKNGDGKISPAELLQCWYAIGMRKLAEDTEALVASLDMDGDGLM